MHILTRRETNCLTRSSLSPRDYCIFPQIEQVLGFRPIKTFEGTSSILLIAIYYEFLAGSGNTLYRKRCMKLAGNSIWTTKVQNKNQIKSDGFRERILMPSTSSF